MDDTIFALSSGSPPAGIGVFRISGSAASAALRALAGKLPQPRRATYTALRDGHGNMLDQAMVLWLPGPGTATGEDVAELHCHGGRAVVTAIECALAELPKLRRATPGEFTRRAFLNGRIDLAEAEGLADLLSAETEIQRRAALAAAGGQFSAVIEDWRSRILAESAKIEAELDFSDEQDVPQQSELGSPSLVILAREIAAWLQRPRAELLKDGFRVVIAGPPNAGKSTLFNALVASEAAITSPVAGTTRDVITRSVALEGMPFVFVDTAGIRDDADDAVEVIGIARAQDQIGAADVVLWLGPEGDGPAGAWEIEARIDVVDRFRKQSVQYRVSARSGDGIAELRGALVGAARGAMPQLGEVALNKRQANLLEAAHLALLEATEVCKDPLLSAESLRVARLAFDRLVGRTSTEDVLDALFGRFCIGK